MKKKVVYIFGIAYIVLLVLDWFVFTNRLYSVDYFLIEVIPQITLFFLSIQAPSLLFKLFLIVFSIIVLFLLEVKKAMISGILGFALHALEDISITFISTRALVLRIFVIVFYFCIQVCLFYLVLKPNEKEIGYIKNVVIDMSEKFTITTIKEISEKTKSDHDTVIKSVIEMIADRDLNAEFFRRSKTLAFYK